MIRRLLCWLGRHDYTFAAETLDGRREMVRRCHHCPRRWRRVRFDMDIYWQRIDREDNTL